MNETNSKSGVSLVEMLISVGIISMVVAGSISGWLFISYAQKQSSTQDKLDLAVRMSLEHIRRDLRLTSQSKMFFYPAGPGPYTAIEFPMADPGTNGLIQLDANTNIIWTQTKIYHVDTTNVNPFAFKVTTITNRDNTLTDAQRQTQINYIATHGNASGASEAANASTRTLFASLLNWSVTPDGAIFDGYASTQQRVDDVILGALMLAPGTHQFMFRTIGKNPSSSGYKIGLDALSASSSGGRREAEKQTIAAQSGASAIVSYFAGGSWSENQDLTFPATATGQYVTLSMENDRWEDSNFGGTGANGIKCTLDFNTTNSPKENMVRLEGMGYAWYPGLYAQNWGYSCAWDSSDSLRGNAVRVYLRGGQATNNGAWVTMDGRLYGVIFAGGASGTLSITDARIAVAADAVTPTPNITGRSVPLLFSGSQSVDLSPYSGAWACPASTNSFFIEKQRSYVISYLVSTNIGHGNSQNWTQGGSPDGTAGSFVIPMSNSPTMTDETNATWNVARYVVDPDINLWGGMYVQFTSNGTYQSAVYDTHQTSPTYIDMNWNATLSASTVQLKVRSGNSNDMSDATSWTNLAWMAAGGTIAPGSGRYVQYMAQLISSSDGWESPKLNYVTIRFNGAQEVVDIGGALTRGPDYGIFEMLIDSNKLQRGVTVSMQVYEDMPVGAGGTKRLTSQSVIEVEPRNTGK